MSPFDPYPILGTVKTVGEEYEHSAGDDGPLSATQSEPARPLVSLTILAIGLVMVLSLRLVDLQVIEGTKNQVLAEGNRIRSREIRPPRGVIQDRTGQVLADNTASYTLEIYPAELPRDRTERAAIFSQLKSVIQLDTTAIEEKISQTGLTSLDPVVLAAQIERETALVWSSQLVDLPGVVIAKRPQRTYADLPGLGHWLGYVGLLAAEDQTRWPELSLAAQVGKAGLERSYEPILRGTPGEERIEVDAKGRIERFLATVEPTQGETLTLTIDRVLQESLAKNLAQAAGRMGSERAAAVVLDVKTGGVLAMASRPDFDPNVFIREDRAADRAAILEDNRQPLLNRVTSGLYPSGSTIKPVIATAALSEGVITPATTLDTSAGAIEIGEWRFPDWKVHGTADVKRAIAESNDIFFYALGGGWQQIRGLGLEKMKTWLKNFGFGAKTGLDLPGEAEGLVPDDEWKRNRFGEGWYVGDSYHLAIGQGFFLTTPLQLARAVAAIANGGTLVTPHLAMAHQVASGGPTSSLEPAPKASNVASPATLALVRLGMRATVTEGTARSLANLPVEVAGKTGTAQFGDSADKQTHSWFVGYAPAETPEIALAVVVEGGGESSDSAVPAAKAFLEDWAKER